MKTLMTFALFTMIAGSVSAATLPVLHCVGTEPFWGVTTFAKGVVAFDSPAMEGRSFYPYSSIQEAAGTGPGYAFQIESRDIGNKTIKMSVVKAECNDGMSDTLYDYNVLVEANGELLYGCCNPVK